MRRGPYSASEGIGSMFPYPDPLRRVLGASLPPSCASLRFGVLLPCVSCSTALLRLATLIAGRLVGIPTTLLHGGDAPYPLYPPPLTAQSAKRGGIRSIYFCGGVTLISKYGKNRSFFGG